MTIVFGGIAAKRGEVLLKPEVCPQSAPLGGFQSDQWTEISCNTVVIMAVRSISVTDDEE